MDNLETTPQPDLRMKMELIALPKNHNEPRLGECALCTEDKKTGDVVLDSEVFIKEQANGIHSSIKLCAEHRQEFVEGWAPRPNNEMTPDKEAKLQRIHKVASAPIVAELKKRNAPQEPNVL